MKIQDFCDMNKFEQIMKNWASSTGLATVAVGADGKYISDCYNFTELCIDLTRGSAEGKKRCEQCDREGPEKGKCEDQGADRCICKSAGRCDQHVRESQLRQLEKRESGR